MIKDIDAGEKDSLWGEMKKEMILTKKPNSQVIQFGTSSKPGACPRLPRRVKISQILFSQIYATLAFKHNHNNTNSKEEGVEWREIGRIRNS